MKRIVPLLLALTATATALAAGFKAGHAKADITPPLGVYMPGYCDFLSALYK